MKYQLSDLFSDVIDTAKEAGIWQTLTPEERKTLVEYFLCHFETVMREVHWRKLSRFMTCTVAAGDAGGGQR